MSIPKPIPRPISLPVKVAPEVDNLLNEATSLYLFEPSSKLLDANGGNHGTITNPFWVGNSLEFVTNGTQVELASVITSAATYSIFILVKPNATGEDFSTLFASDDGSTGLFYRGTGAQTGKIDYYHGAVNKLSTGTLTNLQWSTVAIVATGASGLDMYLNTVAETTHATATASTTFNKIGSADATTQQNLVGFIAGLVFFDGKILSQSDIDNLDDFAMGLI